MNQLIDGTRYRTTHSGIVLLKGKRELHLLGNSVNQIAKARQLMANYSFNKLYSKARRAPNMSNVRFLRIKGQV